MRKGFLSSVIIFFAGASLATAQSRSPYYVVNPAPASSRSVPAAIPSTGVIQLTADTPQTGDAPPSPVTSGVSNDPGVGCHDDPCCAPPVCAGAGVCGPPGRFWLSAEYLMWWIKDANLPPLVTTGPAVLPTPGAIGTPGTVGLLGGNVDQGMFSGGRFTAGFWLNDCQTKGVEASYFFLGSRSNNFTATSSGAPGSSVLARPFLDVSTGAQGSQLIAFPGLSSGTVSAPTSSRLQGAQTNFLCNLCCSCADCCDCCQPAPGYRVDLISGFLFMDLDESLGIAENIQVLPGSPVLPGTTIRAFDQFGTRNQFYGGQLGLRALVWRNRLFAFVTGKIALGDTQQTVDINGSTTVTPVTGPATVTPGGLLALPGNIGRHSRDVFSFIPEVGVNVGYQITDHLSVFGGYTFLYWSHVVRPGDQIDFGVNSTMTPVSLVPPTGPVRPLFTFHESDFWAQGINLGVALRF